MIPFDCPDGFSINGTTVINTSGQYVGPGGSADQFSTLLNAEIAVTGATTATAGRLHVCSGTSADYNLSLPAASTWTGRFIGVRMAHGLTKLVSVVPNGSEKVHSRLGQQSSFIMWADEVATFYSDGSNVFVTSCNLRPMQARLTFTANQYFAANTVSTLLNFNNLYSSSCPASFVTAANASFTIKRLAPVRIELSALSSGTNTAFGRFTLLVDKNGTQLAVGANFIVRPNEYTTIVCTCNMPPLAIGDVLTPRGMYAAGDSPTSVLFADSAYNQFSITELL